MQENRFKPITYHNVNWQIPNSFLLKKNKFPIKRDNGSQNKRTQNSVPYPLQEVEGEEGSQGARYLPPLQQTLKYLYLRF